MKRVINPAKHLKGIVPLNSGYHLGFSAKHLTKIGQENKEIQRLINGQIATATITGRGGALKENTTGKFVRKQPETKISEWKHIEYYSNHHNRIISYDREFFIWEKVMLHKYNLALSVTRSPQGELLLHFPLFTMEDTSQHYLKAGAAMNMCLQLGEFFLPYDENFEPIIPVTKISTKSLLPPGSYGSTTEKLDTIERNLAEDSKEEDNSADSYRFATLREYAPDDVTMGAGGFDEYLIFEYNELDLLVFENLKSGNATYLFKKSKFSSARPLDKQIAKKDPAFLNRIVHDNMEKWKKDISRYLK